MKIMDGDYYNSIERSKGGPGTPNHLNNSFMRLYWEIISNQAAYDYINSPVFGGEFGEPPISLKELKRLTQHSDGRAKYPSKTPLNLTSNFLIQISGSPKIEVYSGKSRNKDSYIFK